MHSMYRVGLLIAVSACNSGLAVAQEARRSAPAINAKQKRVLIAAHRGGYANDKADKAPENSIANLKLAIRKGYDVYETDIQRTADGVFVIMHDATIDRETNGTGTVSEMTFASLRSLRKRFRDGTVSDQPIASLREMLVAGKDKIMFKPDLKPGVIEHFDQLASLIVELKMKDQVFLRTRTNDAEKIMGCYAKGCPKVQVMFRTKNIAQVKSVLKRFHPSTIEVHVAKNEAISPAQTAAIKYAIDQNVLVETHVYSDTNQWDDLIRLGVRMFHTASPDQVLRHLQEAGRRAPN